MNQYDSELKLSTMIRYNNSTRIKDESVAEHCFYVALHVLELHSKYEFNLTSALVLALTHDLAEKEISDVPHNVKEQYIYIKYSLAKAEDDFNKLNKVMEYHPQCVPTEMEYLILELADVISCINYSDREVSLGNTKFREIKIESLQRKNKIESTIGDKYAERLRT